jgi:hypothetical protein
MIIAGMGDREEVIGKRMAIAEVGPIPGNTPTKVPKTLPIKQ